MNVPFRGSLDAMSEANGLPIDPVRVIAALFASVFLAPLSHGLSSPSLRPSSSPASFSPSLISLSLLGHLWNAVLGLASAWFCFDVLVVHSLASTLFTYAAIHLAPRAHVGTIVTVFVFGHLLYANALREIYNVVMMWDGAQMVLCLKLVGTAISYGDGGRAADKKTSLMLRNQLVEKPSLLALFGYIYFYPTFLAGPVFEFNDYVAWVVERRSAPVSVLVRNLVLTVVVIVGYGVSDVFFNVATMDTPAFYPTVPPFARLLLQCVAVMLYRMRFYMVWQLGETAAALAGYGYMADSNDWDGLRNNNILLVECPTNFRVGINNWNIRVSVWLSTYVYQRLGLKNGRPTGRSTLYTFLVSALWHGFLPGYYQFFVMGAIYSELGKVLRRRFRPYFHYTEDRKAHPYAIFWEYTDASKASRFAVVYDLGGMFLTWTMMQYIGLSFVLQDMTRCYYMWRSVNFLPHIIPVVLLAGLSLTEPKAIKAKVV
ncbi:Aste57867_8668 [Aphanomyces stellatus]|uniref:Aste57867_8668 protein n=1 Tax=Aphanomyces stellatus TaxID=120398 RepID=A0A485KKV1_9STRA|nr:hypothetical protein As57867_008634 [Aphanomyces stellatus]VFT85554.1 Aste57867_8668 [Aphanomyces stellatus]